MKEIPKTREEILRYNGQAWDAEVEQENPWTIPVSTEVIAAARQGQWEVLLTPQRPVPRPWFGGELQRREVLCLAGAGGQQGPIFAAAGARVTVLDNSPRQLQRDVEVAAREGLLLHTIPGDMADLSEFDDGFFDLIFHPISNCFVPNVLPVWREAFRVLRPGGRLLAGFTNPVLDIFDYHKMEKGILEVRHTIPYSDVEQLRPDELQAFLDEDEPLNFSHTLGDQIGGQLATGFLLAGFYEDSYPNHILSRYIKHFIATLALKPKS